MIILLYGCLLDFIRCNIETPVKGITASSLNLNRSNSPIVIKRKDVKTSAVILISYMLYFSYNRKYAFKDL